MELKEMIKVMQHYEDGGEIEYTHNKLNNVFGDAANRKNPVRHHQALVLNLMHDWVATTKRASSITLCRVNMDE